VVTEDPVSGDPDDPIRMVPINLGRVSWRAIEIDLANERMLIEITPTPVEEGGEFDSLERANQRIANIPIRKRLKRTYQT
jgi:hypothetical protein